MSLLPFHSYKVETASSARLLNVYGEAAPQGSKGPVILRRAPGIRTDRACGTGPGRGLHVMKNALYGVSGSRLYRIPAAGAVTDIGAISGSLPVSMANNGTQMSLIVPGKGYVFSGGLAEITDADFTSRNASVGKFFDNYLLGVDSGTGQFFCSDLADFSSYDGLDFATAEAAPDDLLTLEVDHRSAILVGSETTELWYNSSSGAGFPFSRIPNGVIELGGASRLGICKQDNSVFIVASDRTFRRLQGNTWLRVSQHGVEQAWGRYVAVTDAECHPYTVDGHLSIAVTFPSEDATWIYDCTTQEWHERASYHRRSWDVSGIAVCYGKIYVQRASTGEIGVLDPRCYTEWSEPLLAEWTYQPLYANGKGVQVHRVEMGVETGVGTPTALEASGDGTDPKIKLELSRKGGREGTFRTVGIRSLGQKGDFKRQVHWDALGTGKDIVLRGSLAAPVPLTIWSTEVDAQELAA